jgi:hypothetical protein
MAASGVARSAMVYARFLWLVDQKLTTQGRAAAADGAAPVRAAARARSASACHHDRELRSGQFGGLEGGFVFG